MEVILQGGGGAETYKTCKNVGTEVVLTSDFQHFYYTIDMDKDYLVMIATDITYSVESYIVGIVQKGNVEIGLAWIGQTGATIMTTVSGTNIYCRLSQGYGDIKVRLQELST